jgi:hypothetical protein
MKMSSLQIEPTTLRAIVNQTIRLHKNRSTLTELQRQLARSLPRDAIKAKTDAKAALKRAMATSDIKAFNEFVDLYTQAETQLAEWRQTNKDLLDNIRTTARNMWTNIKSLDTLGASLKGVEAEGGDSAL